MKIIKEAIYTSIFGSDISLESCYNNTTDDKNDNIEFEIRSLLSSDKLYLYN